MSSATTAALDAGHRGDQRHRFWPDARPTHPHRRRWPITLPSTPVSAISTSIATRSARSSACSLLAARDCRAPARRPAAPTIDPPRRRARALDRHHRHRRQRAVAGSCRRSRSRMSKTKPKWQPGLPPPADLARVARRVVWFKTPKVALADPVHFLCHLMMYTTVEDLAVACRYFSHADFQHAYDHAPLGHPRCKVHDVLGSDVGAAIAETATPVSGCCAVVAGRVMGAMARPPIAVEILRRASSTD